MASKKKIVKKVVQKTVKKVAPVAPAKTPVQKIIAEPVAAPIVQKPAPEKLVQVQPLADRVLVKPLSSDDAGRTLASGIIIPETVNKEKPEQGTVIAVGSGKRTDAGELIPVGVSVGDKIVFSKYGYDEIKINGIEYCIVGESSILAILTQQN